MHVESAQDEDRCNVSDEDLIQKWLTQNKIEDVEAIVPDMAGAARGKGSACGEVWQG